MKSAITGKSMRYIKSGPKMGIECPFCPERIIGVTRDVPLHTTMDEHMQDKHPDFWNVICAYQAVKAHGWPRI